MSHLQAGYGDVQVLWDVTLAVGAGELICIIGSNGAGKTTLMRCISGLLAASAGDIRIDGQAMAQAAPADFVRAGVAHVPEGRRLFSAMSVRDNLLMGAYLRRDKAAIAADLERVYAMFPILADRRWQDAGTLSGGEQQMCAIGRGLMASPSLLLIDELSLGLSPRMVELLSESLREVNKSGRRRSAGRAGRDERTRTRRPRLCDRPRPCHNVGNSNEPRHQSCDPRSLHGAGIAHDPEKTCA